jgi:hypothetical protein
MRSTTVLAFILIVLLSIAPVSFIWALNTLFPELAIEPSLKNYIAAWVLLVILNLSTTSKTTSGK